MLASTSICFDMSVFEIFATLAAGGKILLAENALALPDLAAKEEVALVDTVPSAMAELLRTGRAAAVDPHGEPGRRAAEGIAGRRRSTRSSPASSGSSTSTAPRRTPPSPPVAVVPREAGQPIDRPAADRRVGLRARRARCGRCRSASRARCTSAGKGSPAAICTVRS